MEIPEDLVLVDGLPIYFNYKGFKWSPMSTMKSIDALESFEVRDDDVFVVTYPKSGTHWMKEIVNLLLHDGRPETFKRKPFKCHIELIVADKIEELTKPDDCIISAENLGSAPSPRVIITHILPRLLPKQVWEKKVPVIYVVRNPKDVFLSYQTFMSDSPYNQLPKDIEGISDVMLAGEWSYGKHIDHVKAYWEVKDKENVLIVSYRELKENFRGVIDRLIAHLKINVSEEAIQRTIQKSTIKDMKESYKKSEAEENCELSTFFGQLSVIQYGKQDRWKQHFTVALSEKVDRIYEENLKDYPELAAKLS